MTAPIRQRLASVATALRAGAPLDADVAVLIADALDRIVDGEPADAALGLRRQRADLLAAIKARNSILRDATAAMTGHNPTKNPGSAHNCCRIITPSEIASDEVSKSVGQKVLLALCFAVVAERPQEASVQKLFLVGIAAAGLFSGTALASDLPTKAPVYRTPIAAPPYNWSGFYVGANFGGGWSNGSLNIPGNNLYGGLTEFIGGVQAGYNFQAGHFLFGVEGDFDWAGFGHPALPAPTLGFVNQHWMSTVAGRVGVANDRWLVFAKAGGGWVQSNAILNFLVGLGTGRTPATAGWLAGALNTASNRIGR